MELNGFVIGWITAIVTVGIGYGIVLGVYHANLQRREEEPVREEKKIPVSQEQTVRQEEKPVIELGAVHRPTAEDIEKKDRPIIQEEEEAWGESLGEAGFK